MAGELSVDPLGVRRERPASCMVSAALGGHTRRRKTQWIDYFYRRWAGTLARWNWSP